MESLLCLISAPSLCRAQRLDTERAMSYWLKGQVWVSSRNDTGEAVDHRIRLKRLTLARRSCLPLEPLMY